MPTEIQALAPNAKIGGGVLTPSPPLGASCDYRWGARTSEWGETALNVVVMDASKVWPGGLSADQIKERALGEVKMSGPNASEVPGLGDGAVFTTKAHDALAKAYLVKANGVLLEVRFRGGNPLAQKGPLIALLKSAAARLWLELRVYSR